jgi:hypothetical protein
VASCKGPLIHSYLLMYNAECILPLLRTQLVVCKVMGTATSKEGSPVRRCPVICHEFSQCTLGNNMDRPSGPSPISAKNTCAITPLV